MLFQFQSRYFQFSIVILLLCLVSCKSCNKEIPEQIKYIPGEATVVASVNMKNITLKVAWESITDFNLFSKVKNVLHQYGLSDEIDDPEKSGVSILDNYYLFFSQQPQKEDSYFGAVIPLSNVNKFHDYIDEKQSNYEIQKKGDYEYIQVEKRMVVAWNKTTAIYIAYEHENEGILNKLNEILSVNSDSKTLYNTNSSFEEFQVEKFDIGLWVNAEPIYNDYLKDKYTATQTIISGDYFKNSYITSKIIFVDGEINWDYEYHLNDKSTEFYHQYSSNNINTDIIDFIPTENLLGVLCFTVDIEGVLKAISDNKELVTGYTGMIRSQGYAIQDIVKIFGGDLMIALDGFQVVEKSQYDWTTQKTSKIIEAVPDIVFGASLKNKELLHDLLNKLGFLVQKKGDHYDVFSGSAYLFIEGDYMYVATSNSMKGILISNKDKPTNNFKKNIDDSNLSLYIDLENCVNNIPKIALDSSVYNTVQSYKNDVSSIQLKVNGIKGDVFRGNLKIKFQDDSENSLYTLLNMTEDIDEEIIP